MNDRIDDLIALAALGELNAHEEAELEAAITADPRLADELAAALTGAAALQSSPAEEPPPSLKASVLAAIAGTPQAQAVPAVPAVSRRRSRLAPLLAAAAVLAIVVGGVMLASNDGTETDPIAAVVDADDAVAHSVTGEIGELEFVYSADEDAFVLVGDSLAAAPPESTYQVWLVSEGDFTSLGTFEPDADGSMEMRADGIDPTGSTIGITVEPVGGSEQPTLPPVAASA